jgi:hypothetical protein
MIDMRECVFLSNRSLLLRASQPKARGPNSKILPIGYLLTSRLL